MHVKSEYDYRFESEYRNDIFDAIKYVCWKHNKVNLPVYAVPERLKDFHTSKRDISEGNEIDPDEKFRVKGEDTYPEDPNVTGGSRGGGSFGQTSGNNNLNLSSGSSMSQFSGYDEM